MNWARDPKFPWNWSGRRQLIFATMSAFLQFMGALAVWLVLYDLNGDRVELSLTDRLTGIVGAGMFLAGSVGSAAMVFAGGFGYFRTQFTRIGVLQSKGVHVGMLPWIASAVSFTFGTFLVVAVASRPLYFRDEILGLLATLLVAFAASSRTIEAFTEPLGPSEEE